MGREIRKVPPNWDHPKQVGYIDGRLQPMFRMTFGDAVADWKRGYAEWEAGPLAVGEFWEWDGNPPDRAYYRPWKDEDAIWFQVWETVSEGTPVTPPFETKAELVDYLVANGDFWDQRRGHGGWGREAAEKFVGTGWAPSLVIMGGELKAPRDGQFACPAPLPSPPCFWAGSAQTQGDR